MYVVLFDDIILVICNGFVYRIFVNFISKYFGVEWIFCKLKLYEYIYV